uniref:Uncharacterized protein n=1 Tax=Arsenophonus nasoniae TaxID=638 RepID=D2U1E4_9GAMM|nr:hypothetical protein ARN_23640 [Arsenophonus nasoniae]
MVISHTSKSTVWVFYGSIFQRNGVKERYCLTAFKFIASVFSPRQAKEYPWSSKQQPGKYKNVI